MNSSGSRRLHRLRLQPAAHLGEAGAAQPRLGLLGAGEVPELARRRRGGRELGLARRPSAIAAAWRRRCPRRRTGRRGGRPAAAPRAGGAKSRSWSSDPVEGRGREDAGRPARPAPARSRSETRYSARSPSTLLRFGRSSPRSRRRRAGCPRAARLSRSAVTRPRAAARVERGLVALAARADRAPTIPHSNCGIGDARRRSRRPTRGAAVHRPGRPDSLRAPSLPGRARPRPRTRSCRSPPRSPA